jgi:hypothetical protein
MTRTRQAKRRLEIVLLIAASSVLAAIGAWRTEVHVIHGDELDRNGVAQETAYQREQSTVRLGLVDLVQTYAEFEQAGALSRALGAAAAGSPPAVAEPLDVEAAVEARHADAIRRSLKVDVLAEPRLTAQGLAKKFRDDIRFVLTTADLDPSDEFAASNRALSKADQDAGYTALAIAAAFILTLAQVARAARRTKLLLGLGSLTFVAALLLIVGVEVLW